MTAAAKGAIGTAMKTWICLLLGAASLACAEPAQNDFARDAEAADSAIAPIIQLPPAYEKLLRGGAITITGMVAEVLPPGRINGKVGSFVVVDKFTLSNGAGGERKGLLKIFVHGLNSIPSGKDVTAVIYPCGAWYKQKLGRRYAVSPLAAYQTFLAHSENLLPADQYTPALIVREDAKLWGAL